MSEEIQPQAPVLRVVNPDATPEEIAALVAVFSALSVPAAAPAPKADAWSAPERRLRTPISPGPGGWVASALPR